ncbi:MAG: ATP-dependent DNA ligase [Acidimicrobiales bacterium]
MRFAEVVATSDEVASTRARSRKIAALADLLRKLDEDEVPVAVAYLTGELRQGRIGVGWRMVSKLEVPPAEEPTLEIHYVDAVLDHLAGLSGPGSQGARNTALTDLYSRAIAAEQWFLGRLLVGELRQGALAGILTDAVAKAADVPLAAVRRAAMLAGDLPKVAAIARRGGEAALAEVTLDILRPIQPMLAASASDVTEALELVGGLASVEWKLDGARIQLHRDREDVRIYTRNLNDVTIRLPGIVALARALPVTRIVLDGEAIGWGDGEQPELFQDMISRFSSHDGGTRRAAVADPSTPDLVPQGLEARFFDCLHVDGEDLLDRPLTDRLDALERAAGPWRIPGIVTDDPTSAQEVLDQALAAGHEGAMVKAAGSTYEAGRRGGVWRKVKPVKTLDLVVLAAEWGHGRRQGWLSNLHLGARDPGGDGFVMVGKTFKGLTDELLGWQTEQFKQLATSDTSELVVWVRPELVVEIALDGVQVSTRYPGGVALRFARVRRYRPDKSPADADTIDAVRALLPGG